MKNMYFWLLLPILVYLAYISTFFFIQRKILFPLESLPSPDQQLIIKSGGTLHKLEIDGGVFEVAYLAPLTTTKEMHPVIFLAHGNGNIIDDWAGRMDFMRKKGFAIVLVEYPGYGRSEGSPSYQSIKQAMYEAYQWVEQQPQLDKNSIFLVGRSMGGGAVLTLVEDSSQNKTLSKPAAIILMSTYSSIVDLAHSRWVPAFLVKDPFDNVTALSQYDGPSYLIHGQADKTVPISSLYKLLSVAHHAQHRIYTTGHSDTPDDWLDFWHQVLNFIQSTSHPTVDSAHHSIEK